MLTKNNHPVTRVVNSTKYVRRDQKIKVKDSAYTYAILFIT